MKIKMILLLTCILSSIAYSSDDKSMLKNFGLNLGLGTSIISEGNFDPDVCFHVGIDYTLDEESSKIGLRYHKFNYNFEIFTNIFDDEITIKGDIDLDAYLFYYRFPLKNFTFSLGPGMFVKNGISYFAPGVNIGYLNNISDIWGYELAVTTFYEDKASNLYFYLNFGLWVKF